ncbi:N-terminal nucleophile aminohydrolases (Ntnhydrolases) superfamily protein [Striga asiatica]|uniref:N-terminal nucleophile aminohydrolases (Ntnhydrolases) superfamily protein n=1 Tax=Striga asiatica TaxID=4170 RepID=A0A5A7PK04_STRAF|nr:N-terminal nucleophile aminohydrolases (Ntnhydrolases) superfamily protein [Striga asiatica]
MITGWSFDDSLQSRLPRPLPRIPHRTTALRTITAVNGITRRLLTAANTAGGKTVKFGENLRKAGEGRLPGGSLARLVRRESPHLVGGEHGVEHLHRKKKVNPALLELLVGAHSRDPLPDSEVFGFAEELARVLEHDLGRSYGVWGNLGERTENAAVGCYFI